MTKSIDARHPSRAGKNWARLSPRDSEALRNWDSLPDAACVRVGVLAALYGVSHPTIWRRARSGELPKPTKLGPKTTVWRVGAVREHLRSVS